MKKYGNKINITAVTAVLIAVLICGAAGCFSQRQTPDPTVEEINTKIGQAVNLSQLKAEDSSKLQKLYGINAGELEGFVLYTAPSNIKAEELAVMKVKDPEKISNIQAKIKKRIASKAASFKDYIPEEHYLIEKHVLETHGNYVLFTVSADADKIRAAFEESFK